MKVKIVNLLLIISLIYFLFSVGSAGFFVLEPYSQVNLPWEKIIALRLAREQSVDNQKTEPIILKNLFDFKEEMIQAKKNFIEANLGEMEMRFYKSGELQKEFPILVKGEEGSWSETPAGLLNIIKKHRIAYSILGDVYMPFHMTFMGEYSIHGEPYDPDGNSITRLFTSGCINLKSDDAKELFELVDVGFPLLILDDDFKSDGFNFQANENQSPVPDISAKSYLVADLKSGFVFASKDPVSIFPLGSLSDLMTAVVASENSVLAYDKTKTTQILITKEAIVSPTERLGIKEGDKYPYFELLYPLLISSSSNAAEAFALRFGEENFIKKMNERAASIQMDNTKFEDAYGASSGNASNAVDLFYLARYLLNNRLWLYDISRGKTFDEFGQVNFNNLESKNPFQDDPELIGGGLSDDTGNQQNSVLVLNINFKGTNRRVVFIMSGSEDTKKDVSGIRDWIKNNYVVNNG